MVVGWSYLYISWDSGAPSTMVMDDCCCHFFNIIIALVPSHSRALLT